MPLSGMNIGRNLTNLNSNINMGTVNDSINAMATETIKNCNLIEGIRVQSLLMQLALYDLTSEDI